MDAAVKFLTCLSTNSRAKDSSMLTYGDIYIYIYSLARAVENDIQSVLLLLLADPWQEETLKISMNVSFMTDHAVSATEKSRWHTLHISRPMTLTDIIKRACACQNSQWLALTTKHNSFKYSTRMLAWLNDCCQLRRPDHNDHSLRWPAHSQTVTVWQSDKVFKQGCCCHVGNIVKGSLQTMSPEPKTVESVSFKKGKVQVCFNILINFEARVPMESVSWTWRLNSPPRDVNWPQNKFLPSEIHEITKTLHCPSSLALSVYRLALHCKGRLRFLKVAWQWHWMTML